MKRFRQLPHSTKNLIATLPRLGSAVAFVMLAAAPAAFAQSATPAASFQIEAPTATATVHSPVQVKILVRGATIGSPEDGLDHLHIAVDHGEVVPVYKMPVAPLKLAPGQHTLEVDLAGPDHKPLTAPQSVTFTVTP